METLYRFPPIGGNRRLPKKVFSFFSKSQAERTMLEQLFNAVTPAPPPTLSSSSARVHTQHPGLQASKRSKGARGHVRRECVYAEGICVGGGDAASALCGARACTPRTPMRGVPRCRCWAGGALQRGEGIGCVYRGSWEVEEAGAGVRLADAARRLVPRCCPGRRGARTSSRVPLQTVQSPARSTPTSRTWRS